MTSLFLFSLFEMLRWSEDPDGKCSIDSEIQSVI